MPEREVYISVINVRTHTLNESVLVNWYSGQYIRGSLVGLTPEFSHIFT